MPLIYLGYLAIVYIVWLVVRKLNSKNSKDQWHHVDPNPQWHHNESKSKQHTKNSRPPPARRRESQLEKDVSFLLSHLHTPDTPFPLDEDLKRQIESKKNLGITLRQLMHQILNHMKCPSWQVELLIVYSNFSAFSDSGGKR